MFSLSELWNNWCTLTRQWIRLPRALRVAHTVKTFQVPVARLTGTEFRWVGGSGDGVLFILP